MYIRIIDDHHMKTKSFTFNDFQENSYVLYDDSLECIIIDPGCNNLEEQNILRDFIEEMHLKPVGLVNTHCHIDHVLGNWFVSKSYDLPLQAHEGEKPVLQSCKMVSDMYGISYTDSPEISVFLDENQKLAFGKTVLQILFTPGHSPASISFYHAGSGQLISGDVLFHRSIGRTDLPGGDFQTLVNSINEKLYTLPDETIVYSGHGPTTTIGEEKLHNPFVRQA
jgi:glyoxylase-like metal-dependent hydrolase (beta-lactamase superfamily II)